MVSFRWDFRTFDHDIRFGIKRIDGATGEDTIEIPLNRVSSHQMDEVGFITCQPNCTCKYRGTWGDKNWDRNGNGISCNSSFSVFVCALADKVLFDNSNSYLTTKKIRYSVYITEPLEGLGEEQL